MRLAAAPKLAVSSAMVASSRRQATPRGQPALGPWRSYQLGVRSIMIAARGIHVSRKLELRYVVPDNQVIRLANDPRTPERGSVKVYTEGGV